MNIRSTKQNNPNITAAIWDVAKRQAAQEVALPASEDPPVGFIATTRLKTGDEKVIVGPFWDDNSDAKAMTEFLQTPAMVAVRQIWGLTKSALPNYIRQPGDMIWLGLDGLSLAEKWSDRDEWRDPEDFLALSMKSAATAVSAVSLAQTVAGQDSSHIDTVQVAFSNAERVFNGEDPVWFTLHDDLKDSSVIYKAVDGVTRVAEAALSDEPQFDGVKLNPVRMLSSGGDLQKLLSIPMPGLAPSEPINGAAL